MPCPCIHISIGGHPITPSTSVKYLGVILSSDLRQRVRAQLYKSAVLPKLDYCCAVWAPHLRSDISALENVQKFAARVTTRQWKLDYESLMSNLEWKPLTLRRDIVKLKVCYNIINNLSIIPPDNFIRHPHPVTAIPLPFLNLLYIHLFTNHFFLLTLFRCGILYPAPLLFPHPSNLASPDTFSQLMYSFFSFFTVNF